VATISQIASLEGLGVFGDNNAVEEAPPFRRYNLIYGFNGSGKTTLSRVFASVERGALCADLPEDGRYELTLSDGSKISPDTTDGLRGRIVVFNVDFIEQNLRWKDGVANPVFYLGEEQVNLAEKLDEIEGELEQLRPHNGEAERASERADRSFTNHKRDVARNVAEGLSLGRTYDASNLITDYANRPYGAADQLSEEQQQQARNTISQSAPLPKRELLGALDFSLAEITSEASTLLQQTLGTMTVDDLRDHPEMMKWVGDGLTYHRHHKLANCLFCGKEIDEDRFEDLASAIDARYERLVEDVGKLRLRAESLRERFSETRAALPSDNDISEEFRSDFRKAAEIVRKTLSTGGAQIRTILAAFNQKAATPNVAVESDDLIAAEAAKEWDEALSRNAATIDEVIASHNKSHDEFSRTQEEARTKLKGHFLAIGQERYDELATEATGAKEAFGALANKIKELVDNAEELRRQMREHGVAAGLINRMVRSYLGHGELELGTLDERYELRRNGQTITGSLSEGEKTALAICYFLATLEAEGRKRKDLIIVIDDPISSLDTKALNYAFSIIKAAISEAAQVIILTHNLHFMNEAKKWLKSKTEKEAGAEKATATLMFLDAFQPDGADTRRTSIKEMPRHIREYESEYQYLFHLTLRFLETTDGTGYFYVMPNALRKILDVFLAFKVPGSAGLSSKVEKIAKDMGEDVDQGRILALDRLVQLESHADNLDDLVTQSSMTVEETTDAANALLAVMEALDKPHLDQMRRVCRVQ
jgi:wobble nucleotide-excising tRNase